MSKRFKTFPYYELKVKQCLKNIGFYLPTGYNSDICFHLFLLDISPNVAAKFLISKGFCKPVHLELPFKLRK